MHRTTRTRRSLSPIVALHTVLLGLPSCYSSVSRTDLPPTIPRDNVKVVPPEELAQIRNISAEGAIQIAPTAWWDEVQVDDVLVMVASEHTPEGMLRRVQGRRASGVDLVLDTSQSVLTDVFSEGHLELDVPLSKSPVDEVLFAEEGVTLVTPAVPLQDTGVNFREISGSKDFTVDFLDVKLLDLDGNNSTKDDRVMLNGSLSTSFSMLLDVDLGFLTIDRMEANFDATAQCDFSIVAAPELSKSADKVLYTAKLSPITIAVAGVPVVIVPTVDIVAHIDVSLSGSGVSFNSQATLHTYASAQYDGKWSYTPPPDPPEWTLTNSLQVLSADSLTAQVQIGPRITTKLYSAAGPSVSVFGYLRLAVEDTMWALFGGLNGELGFVFKIGSWDWLDLSASWDFKLDKEKKLAEGALGGKTCGNGLIDGNEQCDGAQLKGASCTSLGAGAGTLVCSPLCIYDTSGCAGAKCGDGTKDPGEECDSSLGGMTCTDLKHGGGTLLCSETCQFDESQCCESVCTPGETMCAAKTMFTCDAVVDGCYGWDGGVACAFDCDGNKCLNQACGDAVQQAPEECDAADFGPSSCQTFGFDGGSLQCTPDCKIDQSSCCNDGLTILNAAYPAYTSAGQGCAVNGGLTLQVSAEMFPNDKIRFHVKKSDNTQWGAAADLRLYVGTGPTCGNPLNNEKGNPVPVTIGQTIQTIDLPIAPYDGAWAEGEIKEFWVGKTESGFEAGRASGTVQVKRNACQ